jgi:hypothetical protein
MAVSSLQEWLFSRKSSNNVSERQTKRGIKRLLTPVGGVRKRFLRKGLAIKPKMPKFAGHY